MSLSASWGRVALLSIIAVAMMLFPAPSASAATTWTDCGKNVCTKYWSKDATNRISTGFGSLGYLVGAAIQGTTDQVCLAARTASRTPAGKAYPFAMTAVVALCGVVSTTGKGASTQPMISAAHNAARSGGCLQVAYPAKGSAKGKQTWSYTTHPSYCKAK